jgi:hypothetical protein
MVYVRPRVGNLRPRRVRDGERGATAPAEPSAPARGFMDGGRARR